MNSTNKAAQINGVPHTSETSQDIGRVFLIVMDSVGIGNGPDADKFFNGSVPDTGADTFGHIAAACAAGTADQDGLRSGPLVIPNLLSLGWGHAHALANNLSLPDEQPIAQWGCAAEISSGKDTPSGHWEMTGQPATWDWGYFPDTYPSFPADVISALCARADIPGILGNCHGSGSKIVEDMGQEHLDTGKPICYTSADSVFQIAAHEESFGLDRLMELCEIARELLDPYNIGRVTARPFVGDAKTGFTRTKNRKDFSIPPPFPTLLDRAYDVGRQVRSVGKIEDIFAHRAMTHKNKASGHDALMNATLAAAVEAADGALIFTNFVDFDSLYGHRRDVAGYAAALEHFDRRLPELLSVLGPRDRVLLTADHGNDPTWIGTDHTREQIPILWYGPDINAGCIGQRQTFADIGQSIAAYLKVEGLDHGTSFITNHKKGCFDFIITTP